MSMVSTNPNPVSTIAMPSIVIDSAVPVSPSIAIEAIASVPETAKIVLDKSLVFDLTRLSVGKPSLGRKLFIFALASSYQALSAFATPRNSTGSKYGGYEGAALKIHCVAMSTDFIKGLLQQQNDIADKRAPLKRMVILLANVGTAASMDLIASLSKNGVPIVGDTTYLSVAFTAGAMFKEITKFAKGTKKAGQLGIAVLSSLLCVVSAYTNRIALAPSIKLGTANALSPMFAKLIKFYGMSESHMKTSVKRKLAVIGILLAQKLIIDVTVGACMDPADSGQNKYFTAGSGSAAWNYLFGIKKILDKEGKKDKVIHAVVQAVKGIDATKYSKTEIINICEMVRQALLYRYNGNYDNAVLSLQETQKLIADLGINSESESKIRMEISEEEGMSKKNAAEYIGKALDFMKKEQYKKASSKAKEVGDIVTTAIIGGAISGVVNGTLRGAEALFGRLPAGEPAAGAITASLGKVSLGSRVKAVGARLKFGFIKTAVQLTHITAYAGSAILVQSAITGEGLSYENFDGAIQVGLTLAASIQVAKVVRKNILDKAWYKATEAKKALEEALLFHNQFDFLLK